MAEPTKKSESSESAAKPSYSHEQLIADAQSVLGATAPTIAAALTYVDKKTLTIDEAQKAVNKYRGT